MCNFRTASNRVVVKEEEATTVTKFGILIPEVVAEKPQIGTIVKVGPGKVDRGTLIPMTVKEGERIMFQRGAGTEVKVDGETYLIIEEDDILLVFE